MKKVFAYAELQHSCNQLFNIKTQLQRIKVEGIYRTTLIDKTHVHPEYATSVHGKMLIQFDSFTSGLIMKYFFYHKYKWNNEKNCRECDHSRMVGFRYGWLRRNVEREKKMLVCETNIFW